MRWTARGLLVVLPIAFLASPVSSATIPDLPFIGEYVPNELLVDFTEEPPAGEESSWLGDFGPEVAAIEVTRPCPFIKTRLVRFTPRDPARLERPPAIRRRTAVFGGILLDLEVLARRIADEEKVASVGPNYVVEAIRKPNEPRFGELWGLHNDLNRDIDAPEAWDTTIGEDVRVAIIDSGVDYNHPDLKDNIWINEGEVGSDTNGRDKRNNGIDDDSSGLPDDFRGWDFVDRENNPMDEYGHGTKCAGIVSAVGNNGRGVVGVGWRLKLVPLRTLNHEGKGTIDRHRCAIAYAARLGVSISSNSWIIIGRDRTLKEEIRRAGDNGLLFVAGAGNEQKSADDDPIFPAAFDVESIVSVAATDQDDKLASFSTYGEKSVDLAAPGVKILTTCLGNSYCLDSGTSMSAPHVAGAAALIKTHYPQATVKEIKERLLRGVDRLPHLKGMVLTSGRLNAARSLQ
jgi:subtilisin family serine protease